jgi:hypothetical protein
MKSKRTFASSVMLVAANETIRSIVLQQHRIENVVAEDDQGFFDHPLFRQDAEYVFFVFSLWRLSEIACKSIDHLAGTPEQAPLQRALKRFRSEVPDATKLRHVFTHIADYAAGQGRDRAVPPGALFSGSYEEESRRPIQGLLVDVPKAREAAAHLYRAICIAIESVGASQAS